MNGGNVIKFLEGVRAFCLLQSGRTSCLCIGYRGRCLSGQRGLSMKLAIHLHLVMRLGIIGSMPPFPCKSLWHAQEKLNRLVMTKCIIETLDTLRANHLCRFRCVETEKSGEGKTDVGLCYVLYLSQHATCKSANCTTHQRQELPNRSR